MMKGDRSTRFERDVWRMKIVLQKSNTLWNLIDQRDWILDPDLQYTNTSHKSIQHTSNYTMICLKIWKEKTDGWAFYLLAHLEAINWGHTHIPPHSLPVYPNQPDSRRRFSIFLAAPALHLPLPLRLALNTQATAAAVPDSGSQGRRGSPRLGVVVSGYPSRLSPIASRPRLRSSAHRPATLRTRLALPSRLRWTVDGARPRRLHCAPRAAGGQREPAATVSPRRPHHFGGAYVPNEALPVRSTMKHALIVVFWNPGHWSKLLFLCSNSV